MNKEKTAKLRESRELSVPLFRILFQGTIRQIHRASETIKLVAQHCPGPFEQSELSEIVKLISIPDGDAVVQIELPEDCRKLQVATARLNDILPIVSYEFRPTLEEALHILRRNI